jgi:hypothetical protein
MKPALVVAASYPTGKVGPRRADKFRFTTRFDKKALLPGGLFAFFIRSVFYVPKT